MSPIAKACLFFSLAVSQSVSANLSCVVHSQSDSTDEMRVSMH